MTILLPEELAYVRELIDQAKFEEALEIIENFEKLESISQKDQLSALLLKAIIYGYYQQYEKAVKISERTYQMSQDLGLITESIQALIGKSYTGWTGDLDNALACILDAERRLNSLADDRSKGSLRRNILSMKSWILLFLGNIKGSEESAEECLKLTEVIGNKLELASIFLLLGWINLNQANLMTALDFAEKSLKLNKELNHTVGISTDYRLIARIYRFEGDYDQALEYCKLSLSIEDINKRGRIVVLETLSEIYYMKGEMNRALKYRQEAVTIAEELKITDQLIRNLLSTGYTYRIIGKNKLGIEYFERSLMLSEKWGFIFQMAQSLAQLSQTHIDENSREKANRYFSRLTELNNQTKEKGDIDISIIYLLSKAYFLKTSTRMRDRVEAQALYKEIIAMERIGGDLLIFSMGNLCDLLLEELSIHNDPTILDEINPLITKSLDMAEEARNYVWLTETKLLQAKLALIQMHIEDAKRFMTQAQRIAELHGLNFLAWGISGEYDKLLDQIDIWDKLKKEEAPISERIKLASTNDVLERIQGRRAVKPSEVVNEEPILLLIMDNSGTTYFNYPFMTNWDYSDLFSSFMSAFNTFSDEIFSKSIDRIRIGENTILINPTEPFLACYVIKGQSYPALQKLNRFTQAIRENSEIWQALNNSVKTSEMLEIDKPPVLKTVINEIFTQ